MTRTAPGRAIMIGALAVATLDMLDCVVVYGLLRGVVRSTRPQETAAT